MKNDLRSIIDCGKFHEIHPRNKKPVGERLALAGVYHLISEEEAFGPIYRDFLYRDQGMELAFDYAQDSFICRGEKVTGFERAGDEKAFAELFIEGKRDGFMDDTSACGAGNL